jgi:hypothetical protein
MLIGLCQVITSWDLKIDLLEEEPSKYSFCPGKIVKGFKRLLPLMIMSGSKLYSKAIDQIESPD